MKPAVSRVPDFRAGGLIYLLGLFVSTAIQEFPGSCIVGAIGGAGGLLILSGWFLPQRATGVMPTGLVIAGCLLLGLSVGMLRGISVQESWIDHQLEGADLTVRGEVSGLPAQVGEVVRFNLLLSSEQESNLKGLRKVRLSWYQREEGEADIVQSGNQLAVRVRLRHPRGNSSDGAFDLEAWAAREGIQATGYVKEGVLISSECNHLSCYRDRIRASIRAWILNNSSLDSGGLLAALIIGDKSAISSEQWTLFNITGTTHLMVISGLHIGLMAGLGFWLAMLLGRLGLLPMTLIALPRLAAFMALMFAFGYALLAGFNIPVQRALVMTGVALSGPLLGMRPKASTLYLVALVAVLTLGPLSITSTGFWYSFGAVAVLLYGLSGRCASGTPVSTLLLRFKPQWLVFVLLLPMLLYNQQQLTLFSPLINLVAIPFIGALIVPLLFLSVLAGWFYQPLGVLLLQGLDTLMEYWLEGMDWLGKHVLLMPDLMISFPSLLLLILAALLLASPAPLGMRRLTPFLLLPWLFPQKSLPESGEVWVSVLDVGQGVAILVRTHSHALLYDTGDAGNGRWNAADRVVVPYLRRHSVSKLDQIMISHGDSDHAGGLERVLKYSPDARVYLGSPLADLGYSVSPCLAGMAWQWDGVLFQVMAGSGQWSQTNDRSCVLKVTAGDQTLLLTGDIGKRVERKLLSEGVDLRADILLVPHHGSKYSSSPDFLETVQPSYALVSAGYRNRFSHPSSETLERLEQVDARVLMTSELGTLSFVMGNGDQGITGYRQQQRKYWHRL